jgi:hypothetical protein
MSKSSSPSVMSYVIRSCYGAGVGALVSLVVNSVMMELFLNQIVAVVSSFRFRREISNFYFCESCLVLCSLLLLDLCSNDLSLCSELNLALWLKVDCLVLSL